MSRLQRLTSEAQNFQLSGPIRTDRSITARLERRQRREQLGQENFNSYLTTQRARNQGRKNTRSINRFLNGTSMEANLNLNNRNQIQRFLDRILPQLEDGTSFRLNQNKNKTRK